MDMKFNTRGGRVEVVEESFSWSFLLSSMEILRKSHASMRRGSSRTVKSSQCFENAKASLAGIVV